MHERPEEVIDAYLDPAEGTISVVESKVPSDEVLVESIVVAQSFNIGYMNPPACRTTDHQSSRLYHQTATASQPLDSLPSETGPLTFIDHQRSDLPPPPPYILHPLVRCDHARQLLLWQISEPDPCPRMECASADVD